MPLNDVLARIPGFAGWEAVKQNNAQADENQIQQYGQLQQILSRQQQQQQAMQTQRLEQQFRAEVQAAPTPEARLAVAQKYMGANQLGASIQGSQDRGTALEAANVNREAAREQAQSLQAERLAGQAALAAENRAQRTADAEANRAQRMQELQLRLQDARTAGAERAALTREMVGLRADAQREAAGARADAKADKPMTEFQGKAALYGTRAAQSDKVLKALEDKVNLTGMAAGQATGMVGNAMMSSEQQRVTQAQRDFVNAVLRQESGAVISDQEFANAKQQYFPAPGDSKAALDQKRANRGLAIKGFARMSGPRGEADIQAIINDPLLPGVSPTAVTPQANTAQGGYVEVRKTADGRKLGKKADGTIEEIR